jgi:hypothetical protein
MLFTILEQAAMLNRQLLILMLLMTLAMIRCRFKSLDIRPALAVSTPATFNEVMVNQMAKQKLLNVLCG